MNPRKHSVFLSYSHDDSAFVEKLRQALDREGVQHWSDQRLQPGEPWREKIEEAIKNAPAFVVILSPRYVDSNSTMCELGYLLGQASNRRVAIVPVLWGGSEAPRMLNSCRVIDAKWLPVDRLAQQVRHAIEPPAGTFVWLTDELRKVLHALLVHQRSVKGKPIEEAVIGYKQLAERAKIPFSRRQLPLHLKEIHEYCVGRGWPPLNALVVNAKTRVPGAGYPSKQWKRDAEAVLNFNYPTNVE